MSDFSYHMRRSLQCKECHNCILNLVLELSLFINCCIWQGCESLLGHPITSYKPIKLSENKSCSEHQTLFFTCKQEYILLCSIYPSVPEFTLEKMWRLINPTKMGHLSFRILANTTFHIFHSLGYSLKVQDMNSFTKST